MNISSLSSSSTVQYTINNSWSSKNTLNSFLLHLHLYSVHVLTIIYHWFTQISQSCENCAFYIQIVSIVLVIVTYYVGIMLNALNHPMQYAQNHICWHNRLKSTVIINQYFDMLITTFIANSNLYKNFCGMVIMPIWYKMRHKLSFLMSIICICQI